MSDIVVFDTTLRDGEQSPGITLLPEEKVEIAHALEDLGVDVIEAGFPIASKGDEQAVKMIASALSHATVCALARAEKKDIRVAARAVEDAKRRRIHTFLSTSDIHLEHQMRVSRKEALLLTKRAVSLAKDLSDDVQFSPMDATRSDLSFVAEVCQAAIDEGARTINIPDTVGYTTPDEYRRFLLHLQDRVDFENVVLSVHTHQDLGLAVANAYSGILAGARQVECTINGIGERAGNCSLEEIVMLLKTRKDEHGLNVKIATEKLLKTSKIVAGRTGYSVPRNKAIVGANAFAHESGIHQDGVLKERSTYEIMNPEDVGLASNSLVLGKHSGRHALRQEVEDLGYNLGEDEMNRLFVRFKRVADQKKGLTRLDLEALLLEESGEEKDIDLVFFETTTGSSSRPSSEVVIRAAGKDHYGQGQGDGPIDSVFDAINQALGIHPELHSFQIEALDEGRDALGQVSLALSFEGNRAFARAVETDVVHAAARAYVRALDRLEVIQ